MKLIVRAIIILAVFVAGFYAGGQYRITPEVGSVEIKNQSATINLMIDNGQAISLYENITIAENQTVFELLKKVADDNELQLGYKDFGGELGVLVESIDGVTNDVGSNGFWQYWVNNSYAKVGPSSYRLKAGDSVTWKYVVNQF